MALSPKLLKWTARLGGAAAVGIGVWVFFALPARCSSAGARICPSFALQSPWILRGERGAAALVGTVVLVVVLCRLVLQGRLPDRIGRDAAEWYPEEAVESSRGLVGLQAVVDEHTEIIDELADTVRSLTERQEPIASATGGPDSMSDDDGEDVGNA